MFRICNPFHEHFECSRHPPKKALSEINTGDPIFYIKNKMDGTRQSVFHENIIYLLDKVFTYNGLKFLSEKQKAYFTRYFYQAGIVTDNINNHVEDSYSIMDDTYKDLDDFLGSYLGNESRKCH